MISKKTKYALQALQYLAGKYGQGPILISELAAEERVPKKFLELILLELKNNGILQSKQGKKGGYSLAKEPKQITLGQVMRITEGPLAPLPCASQTSYERCEECKDESTCGIRIVMKEVRDAMSGILDHTSLADLLERVHEAKQNNNKTLMFNI